MSVLLYDPVKKKHVLLMKEGSWAGKRWSVDLRVCDNPCCSCFHVNFKCTPEDAALNPKTGSVKFVLDTEGRCIYRECRSHVPSDDFAEAVAKELGDEGWDYLQQFLLRVKQEQIENCDPRRLDVDFPPEVLQGDGTMVGYSEIFPLAPALAFSIGSERWFALDDYCVNPDCDCRQVALQFVAREYERDDFSQGTEPALPEIFYDYRKKTFKQAQAPEARQPSLRALLSGLKDQRPDFDAEVKKRHQRLKGLFKRALRKADAENERNLPVGDMEFEPIPQMDEAPLHTPKPGRNDPCPCGSGKKYKKCCGS
jgi:hypothetical protein